MSSSNYRLCQVVSFGKPPAATHRIRRQKRRTRQHRPLTIQPLEERRLLAYDVVTLESINSNAAGNGASTLSGSQVVSADGRYEVFTSVATNLVSGDTNNVGDVFLRDRVAGTTTLISKNSAGTVLGNAVSDSPVISADGRYVAFRSLADNLVATDTNNKADIFLYDRLGDATNRLKLISVAAGSPDSGNDESSSPTVAVNGLGHVFVAYASKASNLVASFADNNGVGSDVFVRDLESGTTRLVSGASGSSSNSGDASSGTPRLSSDASRLTFESLASNLVATTRDNNAATDVLVHDIAGNATAYVSTELSAAATANRESTIQRQTISSNGQYEVFTSTANDLVHGVADTNGATDVFLRDRVNGTTTLVSRNTLGNAGNGQSANPVISANGRYVAYQSTASDLSASDINGGLSDVFLYDRQLGTTTLVSVTSGGSNSANDTSYSPTLAVDGSSNVFVGFVSFATDLVASFSNANGTSYDVFLRNVTSGETRLVSGAAGSATTTGNNNSGDPLLSADASRLVFVSHATDLVSGVTDGNSSADVFAYKWSEAIPANRTKAVSVTTAGTTTGNGESTSPVISSNGNRIAWVSSATNLTSAGDANGATDVFVRDLSFNQTTLVSKNSSLNATGNGHSITPSISDNGNWVAFASSASDLVSSFTDTNSQLDVFLANVSSGVSVTSMQYISVNTSGSNGGNGASSQPVVVQSGSRILVAFRSTATDLVVGFSDQNGSGSDIFVRNIVNLIGATTSLVSHNTAPDTTATGNGDSSDPFVSADGSTVTFASDSTNLTADADVNSGRDVFFNELIWTNSDTTVAAGENRLISAKAAGAFAGFGVSDSAVISGDGDWVAFRSSANALTASDANTKTDVFLRELPAGFVGATTSLVSRTAPGGPSANTNYESASPAISDNGQYVGFESTASDLSVPATSGNRNIFLFNRLGGSVSLVSVNSAGDSGGNGDSDSPTIGVNGGGSVFVAFASNATNLVSSVTDANAAKDVFLRDLSVPVTRLMSHADGLPTTAGNGAAYSPRISTLAGSLLFESLATNLTNKSDTNSASDVFAVPEENVVTPIDIVLQEVSTDGYDQLTITYQINLGDSGPFQLGFYRSSDTTIGGGDTLVSSILISNAGDLTQGSHTKTFTIGAGAGKVALPGAGDADVNEEYFLLGVADHLDAVLENDANLNEDNTQVVSGVYHAAPGAVVIFGRAIADVTSIGVSGSNLTVSHNGATTTYALTGVTEVRVRGYGGADSLSLSSAVTKPAYLAGGEGNDVLLGGKGNDVLDGGAGDDSLTGGSGNDSLLGGGGNDAYFFKADAALGSDSITDTAGVDRLDFGQTTTASVAVDLSLGTPQAVNANLTLTIINVESIENLSGGAKHDTLIGSSLANVILGNAGDDSILGGAGNDSLTGGGGNDSLTGGANDDTYYFDADVALGQDTLDESAGGVDTLDFTLTTTRTITLDLGQAGPQVVNTMLTLGLGSGSVIENVIGGRLNDVLSGNLLNNVLSGGLGNDLYLFDADVPLGEDTIDDGAGVDTIDFGSTTTIGAALNLGLTTKQTVNANLKLTLTSNVAIENLFGGAGADTLTGNGLVNTLEGRGGNDTLDGSSGNDKYLFDTDNVLGTDTLKDSDGKDLLDFSSGSVGISLNLGLATTQVLNGNLSLKLETGIFEDVLGTMGPDNIAGNSADNRIEALAGDDTVSGGDGKDTYAFDADTVLGSDTINDTSGVDTLDFSATTSLGATIDLSSTAGQVVNANLSIALQPGAVLENVIGTAMADLLTGNDFSNTFTGGGGNDTLIGGAGNDVYLFDADNALGEDTVTDTAGIDRLDFARTTTRAITVDASLTSQQTVVNPNLKLTISVMDSIENLTGGAGNDSLTGNGLANALIGNAGNDTLNGGAGNDSLTGSAGNDLLIGGADDDVYPYTISGDLGQDTLDESGGGLDTLDFSKTAAFGITVDMSQSTAQVVSLGLLTLTLGSGTTFENILGGALGDNITGNSLANRITGGAGNDTLAGGAGDDIYLFDADFVLGSDTLNEAGGGRDWLDFSATAGVGITLDLSNAAAQNVAIDPGTFAVRLALTLGSGSTFENVRGTNKADSLTGNLLSNILVGLGGNDSLFGNGDRDLLFGGLGLDTILGGTGDDLLIAGTTNHDSNNAALDNIHAEWTSGNDYPTRRDNLRLALLVAGVTVKKDGNSIDSLTGDSDRDWFFAALAEVTDKAADEDADVI